ncbi:hypothetical protein SAMN04488564_10696 [Lentzea waywayandensis]|uniref:Uncharacterized protein n=1 Tax=Lentzea waywayandensis TaxID=84724 RepID=A0A1I6EX21_9PSEU|nr:hypothetical protein [Lentzea waywayandensis]SFR22201.1 hypothetical protein SAMN04488564_10696 [Lentzea waywayandensis]
MVIKVRGWFTPLRIGLAGTVLVALLLLVPISFRAPGDHEMTDCGSPLAFDPRGYNHASERRYWDDFVRNCMIGRTTRLAQVLGVLAVTSLLVTFTLVRPSSRRATAAADDAEHS